MFDFPMTENISIIDKAILTLAVQIAIVPLTKSSFGSDGSPALVPSARKSFPHKHNRDVTSQSGTRSSPIGVLKARDIFQYYDVALRQQKLLVIMHHFPKPTSTSGFGTAHRRVIDLLLHQLYIVPTPTCHLEQFLPTLYTQPQKLS